MRGQRLRQSLRNVAREVSDVSRGHAGHIRIGVGPTVNDEFLLAAIIELLRAEPRITMKVMVSDIDEILPALQSGAIDVVFNLMVFKPPAGLAYIPLREDECVVLCAPNHRLAARTHVPLAELSKERWALGEPGLPTQQRLHQVFRDNGLEPPRVALESRLLSLRVQAAANAGLLMYSSRSVATRFGTGDIALRALPVPELRWVRSVGVLHRAEPYLSPAVRRFIEILTRITSGTAREAVPLRR
jgi:DNA-binding transcriptional LysR family regulator